MNQESIKPTGGQEGIIVGAGKQSRGDREFHEQAMLTDQAAEQADLERIAGLESELAERQVMRLAQADAAMGKRGYRALIRLYPDHPHRAAWEAAAKE